jgi:hypothetical protein
MRLYWEGTGEPGISTQADNFDNRPHAKRVKTDSGSAAREKGLSSQSAVLRSSAGEVEPD